MNNISLAVSSVLRYSFSFFFNEKSSYVVFPNKCIYKK